MSKRKKKGGEVQPDKLITLATATLNLGEVTPPPSRITNRLRGVKAWTFLSISYSESA